MALLHPLDFLDIVKRERRTNVKSQIITVVALHFLAFLANYTYVFLVSFPLASKEPIDANIFLECFIITIPLLTWVIASYAMSSIMSGESEFLEILTTSSYALVPFIIFTPLMALVSQLLGSGEAGMYATLRYGVILWVLILLVLGLQRLNDYTIPKTIIVTLVSVLAMVIIWAVCLLLFSLTIQLVSFFTGFWQEINLKYFY